MDKVQRNAIVASLSITLFVSIGLGAALGLIAKSVNVGVGVGILAIIAQFLISYLASSRYERQSKEDADNIINGVLEGASELKVPITLSCAYCNVINRVPLSLLEDNLFKCNSCNQSNKVYIQYSTVRITTPIASTKLDMRDVDDEGEETQRQTTINESIKING